LWRQGRALALWVGLLMLVLALAGCAGDETALVPTPTLTRTPRPTFTPVPPSTVAPTITPTSPPPTLTPTPTPTLTPTRNPNVSPLTGLVADPAKLNRRVLAIRVGNDPEARPQEGLGAADLVYEEIMDGWVLTRFTALYLESDAERVRPLRSARLSNLVLAPQYDAALVHTGASDPIRWLLSQATFVDLDQYFHAAPYGMLAGYDWRGRMYTSTEAVHAYLERIGKQQDHLIEGYEFDPTPPEGTPAPAIRIPYPRSSVVDWEYDAASGHYLRYVQGQPHVDALTNQQIVAENVIIFYTEHLKTDIVEDSLGSTAIDIVMEGSGRAVVCRDGVMIEAEWRRTAEDKPILYWDANGEVIPLRPGKTWIQLVPPDYEVVFE
jgi:hypothetical protein